MLNPVPFDELALVGYSAGIHKTKQNVYTNTPSVPDIKPNFVNESKTHE